jgi:predicted O-methyltransferase YrrM
MQNESLTQFLKHRDLLEKFEKESRSKKIPVITKDTGYLLELAVLIMKPSRILEIGCGNGFSTYFLVKNLNSSAKYTGIDMNRERLSSAKKLIVDKFPEANTEFICRNALDILPGIEEAYDLVFIDGAKFEYPLYVREIMKKLNDNAIIIADNILYGDRILSPPEVKHYKRTIGGLKEYLRIVSDQKYFKTAVIGTGDGIAVSIYRGGL